MQLRKATHKQTKTYNARLVLKTVYDNDRVSRADVARLTHLTRTTVSDIVTDLLQQGLVEEVGRGPSAGGKSPILLSVVDNARHLLALDLAGDEFRGAVLDLRGRIVHTLTLPIRSRQGDEALNQVFELVDALAAATDRPLLGIGIGTPGLVDTSSGTVRRAVNLDWHDLPLRELVQARAHVPVYIGNDSQIAALAQYVFGGTREEASLIVIKVGQGVGAGLVLNGQLFQGDGSGAGEIGHTIAVENGLPCRCGNSGCLETVIGSRALLERARALAGTAAPATLEELARAFNLGDDIASRLVAETGRSLGMAVANLVGALNVRHIVIAGSVAAFGPALADAVQNELPHRALPALAQETCVEVSSLGDDIVILGASALLLVRELGLDLVR